MSETELPVPIDREHFHALLLDHGLFERDEAKSDRAYDHSISRGPKSKGLSLHSVKLTSLIVKLFKPVGEE